MEFNLKSGMFTLLSAHAHDVAENLKSAVVSYKLEANGAAGALLFSERVKIKQSRTKNILHGYVVRNDKRIFQFLYNLENSKLECKKL